MRVFITGLFLLALPGVLFGQNTTYQQDPNWQAPASASATPAR